MSIEDQNGNQIVRLGVIHAMAFKMLIWIGMVATPAAFALFWSHSESIKLHEWRISSLERAAMSGSNRGVSQSVNVGDAGSLAADESGRVYLTTADVAKREKIAERTVVSWIEQGRIEPVPEKMGKGWAISAEYRILPQSAASSGTDSKAIASTKEGQP